jgi:D-alanine-D-alanine ligase
VEPTRILVCGGTSDERRVSVASAQNVVATRADFRIWFVDPGGAVHECAAERLLAHERPFENDFDPRVAAAFADLSGALDAAPRDAVVFLALHGGDGENGVVQGLLEARGLAFTGSGSRASALAFDKTLAKQTAAAAGVRVAAASTVEGDEARVALELREALASRGPLVVKPVAGGSSIGLCFVAGAGDVAVAAAAVAKARVPFLVEDRLVGIELTVGVVESPGGGPPVALPPSEVRVTEGAAFDYAGKYLGRGTREITPAEVPREVAESARRLAVRAHEALGCYGYSRTDMMVDGHARGPCFLETNTLPGLTRASFIPQQLAASARPFEAFLDDQIALAYARAARQV